MRRHHQFKSQINHLQVEASAGDSERSRVDNYPLREVPPPWRPPARSTASRKVTGRGQGSSRGGFCCKRFGREITYESGLERRAALIMAADRSVVNLMDQPEPVIFRDEARLIRHHTFDYLAKRADDGDIYAFVKSAERLNEQRRALVTRIARHVDPEVVVITEREASHASAQDASWLQWADIDDAEADATIARQIADLIGAVSLQTIADRAELGPRGLRAAFRAIRDGRLVRCHPHAALNPDCLVRPSLSTVETGTSS